VRVYGIHDAISPPHGESFLTLWVELHAAAYGGPRVKLTRVFDHGREEALAVRPGDSVVDPYDPHPASERPPCPSTGQPTEMPVRLNLTTEGTICHNVASRSQRDQ